MTLVIRKETLMNAWALAFAGVMLCVPWEGIFETTYGYSFVDRSVYLDYFLFQQNVLEYGEFGSFLNYVSNEFLWNYVIDWLVHGMGVPIEYVFGAISFVTLFVFGRIIAVHAGSKAMLMLVNPLVVDFAFSQLRLALAISLLGLAYLLRDRKHLIPILLVAVTPFVHTAAVIFIGIYVVLVIARSLMERYERGYLSDLLLLVLMGAFISILTGPLREALLSHIGDRRAAYPDMASTFLYSLFWVSLLIPFAFFYRQIVRYDHVRYTVVILSIVAINLLTGGYSSRFLSATFPFIVSSMFSLPKQARIASLVAFVFYAVLQWLYWFRLMGG